MELKGLFVGLNTIDIQFFVENYPAANEKCKAKNYGLYSGGPATNAAITFAHLGGSPQLVSSFGQHVFTEIVFKELINQKVAITDMTPDRDCHPVFASVVTSLNSGERSIVSYHPDYHDYCDITLDNFPVTDYAIILADSFYIDAAKTLIEKSNGQVPVVLDGGSWKPNLEKLLPLIDVAICSADFYPPGTNNHDEVISFLSSFGISKIAVTQGEEPIIVIDGNERYKIKLDAIEVKDTLGAGDVFHGAFCYYYALNGDLKQALTDASMVAGRSCMAFGTRDWMKL